MTTRLKELFLLDPDVIFLFLGSFGACPRPVFEAYQAWQRRLEKQPVRFLLDELPHLLRYARHRLGAYLNVSGDDLVFVPNATFGVNVVARSLPLGAGDEVLTTDHEYGACDRAWEFNCRQKGVRYVRQHISLPVTSAEELVEQLWQGVTPRTRVVFLSHISSFTALRFPVEEVCRRAREAGIVTVVDGAHVPGQLALDITAVSADFYTGNCHKWLCAPKGSAFLYARPEVQHLLEPLIVSWGWESDEAIDSQLVQNDGLTRFLRHHQWVGTKDPSAYLTVPHAIDFQAEHNWRKVRQECHRLAAETLQRITELTGLSPVYPPDEAFFGQMFVAPLPAVDLSVLKKQLYDAYKIEVPLLSWQDYHFIRVSVQGYNTQTDMDVLLEALATLLPKGE